MSTRPPPDGAPTDHPGLTPAPRRSILDRIEWLGNKLPEPAILFAILALIVFLVSGLADALGWKVQPVQPRVQLVEKLDAAGAPVLGPDGAPVKIPRLGPDGRPEVTLVAAGAPIEPRSLMTIDGLYWMLSSMIRNFVTLPALGLVFVGMLGIGLAEKFGLFSALMRAVALATPQKLLTPVVVFIGANSSVASDAGYIILPPLAAALYVAVGRHPVAGLAAAFAGVAGGFGGGLFPTAADGFLAGTATQAAHIIDPTYKDVLATHNLYFKAGSAVVVMLAGWFVTDRIVEPRLNAQGRSDSQDTSAIRELTLTPIEKRGLALAVLTMALVLGSFAAMVFLPGAPLHGRGVPTLADGRVSTSQSIVVVEGAARAQVAPAQNLFTQPDEKDDAGNVIREGFVVAEGPGKPRLLERPGDRWAQVIVPAIFLTFLLPGMVYGYVTGVFRTQRDFIEAIYHGIRSIVPVLTIAFFMGQFVNYFAYSGLDQMLAYAGGSLLVRADLPVPLLLVLFVLLVVAGDFAISGMLSKYAILAPIFIPMFMMVGISPELMTASYRIGDSVVNIITPLNSYLLIILVVLQKYKKDAGLGSLIALMLPYSVVFFLVWTGFLLAWYFTGLPLGTKAPLHYVPPI
jgi:aminobenzoyl-glutamate transport protein